MGEHIKIGSLNCNGLCNHAKQDRLLRMFNDKKHNLDIVLIQETKLNQDKCNDLKEEWHELTGGQRFFAPSVRTKSSGVAILLNNKL